MPKKLMVLPQDVRKKGKIKFSSIPMNQYDLSIKDELKRYSKEDLLNMQKDMMLIRNFENMLNEIKLRGAYMLSLIHI